jgi:hypothetical protein
MKILITGNAGFIVKYFYKALDGNDMGFHR